MPLLAFLKNRGFGRKGVLNFTKSFSVLSSLLFRGLKAPLLPCVRVGWEKRGSHAEPAVSPPPQEVKVKLWGAKTIGVRPKVTEHLSRDVPTSSDSAHGARSFWNEGHKHFPWPAGHRLMHKTASSLPSQQGQGFPTLSDTGTPVYLSC